MHEIEVLGRSLTWTEEGLEYEGSDKHRRALLEGLGLIEESKAVNSATVKPEEMGHEEDTEILDASETKRFRNLAKMGNPTRGSCKRLKKADRNLKGVEKLTWVMKSWKHDDEVNVDVHVVSDWAKGAERGSTREV